MFQFPKNKSKTKFISQWCVLLLVVALIYQHPYWTGLDERYNDYWRIKIAEKNLPGDEILVIDINDQSLTQLEPEIGRWPWPRTKHAFLVNSLIEAKTKAIVFDVLFSEKDTYRPDFDEYFSETLAAKDNVFLAAALLSSNSNVEAVSLNSLPSDFFLNPGDAKSSSVKVKLNLPLVVEQDDWNIGLINFIADDDGVARRYPRVIERQGLKMFSLPQKVVNYVNSLTGRKSSDLPKEIFQLKYKGLDEIPFNSLSYVDADYLLRNQQQLEFFKDKIVIIGTTATALHDLRETPILQRYPGTSILATAIDNLLNEDILYVANRHYGLILLLLATSLMWLISQLSDGYKVQLVLSGFLLVLSTLGLYFLSLSLSHSDILFPSASILVLLFACMVNIIFYRGLKEYLSRQHTLQTFSRFMDPVIVKQLISDEDWQDKIANKSSQVSVLFSDIRGFTSLSEKRSAEEIMQLLNGYFDLQVETIFETKGTLDKFIGDAVMAFWGAPIEDNDHAINAVESALRMVDNLMSFRESLPEELRGFDVGIGVHSGEAVVGMLGSSKRFDYTAIGDTVNLASRIEGATKGIARVLVSQETKELCRDSFSFEFRGEFSVKGREEKVKLYQPIRK